MQYNLKKIGCGEEKTSKKKSAAAEKCAFLKFFYVENPSIYAAFRDSKNKMKKVEKKCLTFLRL